ncbi:MAG: pirin family protein [Planctomycetes bacterium]|nr:pirin family protein [Planctomycetota bacterium]
MTFDSEDIADDMRRGFRALESLNEVNLAPGASFLPNVHEHVEILTYVRMGVLTHQDALGRPRRMGAGEFLRTSARCGTDQCKLKGSPGDYTQILQSCITPDRQNLKPSEEQKRFAVADRRGILRLIASPNGGDRSLRIRQDVQIHSALVDPGTHLIHELRPGRCAWLHVVKGRILLIDHCLRGGDGAALVGEAAVSLTAQEASEVLLFDLA